MAADPLPTIDTLVNEGLDKFGDRSLLTRAKEQWMPEIKHDIFSIGKKLKSLHITAVLILTPGLSRYSMPTDYSSDMVLQLLTGFTTGTAGGGATGSITLAIVGDAAVGDSILITENTAKGSMSQVTAIDSATKIASVSPDFDAAPDATSTYRVITKFEKIEQRPLWDLRGHSHQGTDGDPRFYFPIGDSNDTELELFPNPDIAYGIQLTYYADLTELDITGTLMATLYKRWRNVFVQGIYAKALQSFDDGRTDAEMSGYRGMLSALVAREQYGMDLSNLQATVSNY